MGSFVMEMWVANGSIQVNQQTTYGGGCQRRCKCRSQSFCHDERAGVKAAVGVKQRLVGVKQVTIQAGNPVAAVFASDHEAITAKTSCAFINRRIQMYVQSASPVQIGQPAEYLPGTFSPLFA